MEKDLTRFDARDQARLLEALAQAHFFAGRPKESVRLLRWLATLPLHVEDIRVRMQIMGLALGQDDEPEMLRVLAEVKKIEGEPATEYSYGEALRLMWRARHGEIAALEKAHDMLNIAATRRPDLARSADCPRRDLRAARQQARPGDHQLPQGYRGRQPRSTGPVQAGYGAGESRIASTKSSRNSAA